jgi:nicotinate-nucleotide adenylyltransferase
MLGLLGGTFDPVHVGHLRLAIEVRERLGLDRVRLLPAPRPRLRDAPRVDAQTRARLLRAAVGGVDGLEVDARELQAPGPTRTVETLEGLREEMGERPMCLILGADAAARLDRWYDWQRLVELAHLVIARRPGAVLPEQGPVAELLARHGDSRLESLRERPAGVIHVCEVPALDVSASAIRERLRSGRSIEFLVPEGVRQMLMNEDLYIHG